MSTGIHATPRRARRIGVIAALFAVAAVLAGCSASDSTSSDTKVAGAANDAGFAGAPAAEGTGLSGADRTGSAAADRSVIITGTMYMTVKDPIGIADQVTDIVQRAGGRIDARNETAPDKRNGGSANLTLRIPSDHLDAVVDALRKLGTVDQFSTSSSDVTTEVRDLDAKISTLRASTARIEGLLADAKNIPDIITLENELDSRQSQLQSLEAQQRGLDDQVSMSTIDLSLTTEPVVIVDDSPDTFWDGLVAGWNGLMVFISFALIIIGVLLPWVALMGLIAFAIVLAVRARKSRIARRRTAWAVAQAASGVPAQPAPVTWAAAGQQPPSPPPA